MSLISSKIIKDSISPHKVRLITLQLKAPKFLDAECEKHRMISSNSSSDRAKPLEKLLSEGFYVPEEVYLNQAGMQGKQILENSSYFQKGVKNLFQQVSSFCRSWSDIHKQHINRYLLGFTYQDKVMTATEDQFNAFFKLRLHEDAQPEIRQLAECMKKAIDGSIPEPLENGQWHLPYVSASENLLLDEALKASVARCARVSYSNHDGSNPDFVKDEKLYEILLSSQHMSPFEHQATAMKCYFGSNIYEPKEKGVTHVTLDGTLWSANFKGWIQYRKLLD